jgi:hypothetical protein
MMVSLPAPASRKMQFLPQNQLHQPPKTIKRFLTAARAKRGLPTLKLHFVHSSLFKVDVLHFIFCEL